MQLGTFLITSPLTLTREMGIMGVNIIAQTGTYTIIGNRPLIVNGSVLSQSVALTKTTDDAPLVYQSVGGSDLVYGMTITPSEGGVVQMEIQEV